MNLRDIINSIENKQYFIPTYLEDRSTSILIDEYCKIHPYFEKTVRQVNSMFHYITFSEVLDTIDYIINNEFRDMLLRDLDEHPDKNYVFIYYGKIKSGFYFTLIFLKYLSNTLDVKYWDRIILDEYNGGHINFINPQYVLVDDAAYSGYQMFEYADRFSSPIVILVASSKNGYDKLMTIDGIRIYVGNVYPNIFEIDIDDIFRDLDIFYESNGKVHSLLDSTLCREHDENAVSNFYFQHKHPDYVSIPQCLIRFPNPEHVDKILTLEEKYRYIGRTNGAYVTKRDYNIFGEIEDNNVGLYSFIQDINFDLEDPYEPFYRQKIYTDIIN